MTDDREDFVPSWLQASSLLNGLPIIGLDDPQPSASSPTMGAPSTQPIPTRLWPMLPPRAV
jgi:hypothetical protein